MHDELTEVAQHTAAPGRGHLAGVARDLARPVLVVGSGLPVADLEVFFRDQELTCVAVQDDDGGDRVDRVGLITRARFTGAMTGRLGYGRAVLLRRPTGDVTDWSPLVVAPHAPVAEVATRAMERPGERRYDEVLVHDAQWGCAEAADLVLALVAALAQRSTHDPLTRLPGRPSTWHGLTRRCEMAARTRGARVVLVLLDVRGMAETNARHGQANGDALLAELARRLQDAVPAGCDAGRVDGDRFAVVATLPPVDDLRAAAAADAMRQRMVAALMAPSGGIPPSAWPWLHSSVVWSVAGAASPDELIREGEARLRQAKAAARRADTAVPSPQSS
ncbi:MAG TPA: diguanylate cyclase [Cellulomonas sp.]